MVRTWETLKQGLNLGFSVILLSLSRHWGPDANSESPGLRLDFF